MELVTPSLELEFIIWTITSLFILINVLRNKFENNDKLNWSITIILIPILGSGPSILKGERVH